MDGLSRQSAGDKPKRKQTPAQLANLTGGSRKNKPNKFTVAVKDMILGALTKAGGETYLLRQAEANPVAFMGLVGKVLPLQLTGEGGGAIVLSINQDEANL